MKEWRVRLRSSDLESGRAGNFKREWKSDMSVPGGEEAEWDL